MDSAIFRPTGYEGGRWITNRLYYNRSVTNVNSTEVHKVYNTNHINRHEDPRQLNGGDGGIRERALSGQK